MKTFQQVMILVLFVAALALSACKPAEPTEKPPIAIGVLNAIEAVDETIEGFREGMAEFGYVETEAIIYLYEGASADKEALTETARGYAEAEVDLILAVTNSAVSAAQAATVDIPIVFTTVINPVELGFVEDIQTPGGRTTGITASASVEKTLTRRLDWFKRAAPAISDIFIPYEPSDQLGDALEMMQALADDWVVDLVWAEVTSPDEATALLENMPEEIDSMFFIGGRAFVGLSEAFIAQALEMGLPVAANSAQFLDAGAFLTFAPDSRAVGMQAARLAHQVLQGGDPGTLPVEVPELRLTINLKVAEAVGVEVPDDVLEAADEIVRD